jgi:four helix bundle protein
MIRENDLLERLLKFSIRTIKFSRSLPNDVEIRNLRNQLSKSCSSPGANYEEAQAASSKKDFHNKVKIGLREIRETNYWLRVIKGVLFEGEKENELECLLKESTELKNILGTIVRKTK